MKSQNFKNHYFARFEKNCLFFPTLATFIGFLKNSILTYIYSIFMLPGLSKAEKIS